MRMTTAKILFRSGGRIGRKTYWSWMAPLMLLNFASILVFGRWGAVDPLYGYILVLPSIYVTFQVSGKRWHDVGSSAWWNLLMLIPLLGILVPIALGAIPGDTGENRFGFQDRAPA